jgi:hypothetical protein
VRALAAGGDRERELVPLRETSRALGNRAGGQTIVDAHGEDSIEEQIARSLDAVFGPAIEPVAEVASGPPPDLVEVPELLSTHLQYG